MAEPAAEIRGRAHLPEEPGQGFSAGGGVCRQKRPELLGQVHQDGAGFKHADGLGSAVVHQGRYLGVGVHLDEAAAELIAIDPDQPGVIFGARMAGGQQLFQHDGHLDPVGRAHGIELQGVLADRQRLFVGGTGDGAIDGGEPAPALLVPGPDLGRGIFGRVGHGFGSWGLGRAV